MASTENPPRASTTSSESEIDTTEHSQQVPVLSGGWRLRLAFATLCVLALAAALESTSLSPALPIIITALHGTTVQALWAGISANLSSTVFQLVFVSFSSIFGRKPMIMIAVFLFAVGGITGAVAQNPTALIVGRTILGAGSGAIIVLTEVIVTDLVPMRVRGTWFGFISLAWAVGTAGGPVIGGVLAENSSWRWIFWIVVPISATAGVMIPLFLNIRFRRKIEVKIQIKAFDWLGLVLFMASSTSFLIAITLGGVMYRWSDWKILVPLTLGSVGSFIFVLYEIFVANNPFLRLNLFKNVTAAMTILGAFLHGCILWSLLYYLPLYYEAVQGFTSSKAGLAVFPETLTIAPASLIVGLLVARTGRFQWSIIAGWLITILGTGLLYLLDVHTPVLTWIGINIVVGLGTGMLFSGMAFSIQAAATALGQDSAFAIAMFTFFRSFGTAVGIAVGGVVFQNEIQTKLNAQPSLAKQAAQYTKDAVHLASVIKSLPIGGIERTVLTQVYADALKKVWLSMCVMAVVGTLLCPFTREYSLDVKLNAEQFLENVEWKEKDRSIDRIEYLQRV